MKKILAAIDGSPEADAAAQTAADLAAASGARLTIVYVVPHHPPPGPAAYLSDWERGDVVERDYAPALLRDVELRCQRPGLEMETMTSIGPIADTLADLAEAGAFDLVVVGHRGRGAVKRTLLGSVADRLVQISPRPVLVVR